MVEKWLLQVQGAMTSSIRHVISEAVQAYKETDRKDWVVNWAGQVVICVSSIYWTAEVTESIAIKNGLKVSK